MTSPTQTSWDHQIMPEDNQNVPDQGMPEEVIPDPAAATMTADPQLPAAAANEDPGVTAVGSPIAEPGVADGVDGERPSAVSAPGAETASAGASPAASDSTRPSTRWHEIQAMFVDDPRAATELAAGLVAESAEALVLFVKRQQSLLSEGDDGGTEELRIALQHYRAFWNRIEDFSRGV